MKKVFSRSKFLLWCAAALLVGCGAGSGAGASFPTGGLSDQLIADFKKAIADNPSLLKAYCNRSALGTYRHAGCDETIIDLTQAIALNPRNVKAYNDRGRAYADYGLYDQAIADDTQALAIDPGSAEAYFNKGEACEKVGRVQEAIEAYKGFLQHALPPYDLLIEQVRQRIPELEQ